MSRPKRDKLDSWIFDTYEVSKEGLGLLRMAASMFIFFFLLPGNGLDHFYYLSSLPTEFYNPPPGPLSLLNSFPSEWVFITIFAIAIVSLGLLFVGLFTKTSSILAGLSILALQGLVFSVGKVNHEIMLPLVPLFMAFSNWGAAYSMDAKFRKEEQEVESWPLVLLSLFIAFMMLTAGIPKILGGWLDPSTQAVKGHVLNQYIVKDRDALLAGMVMNFDVPLFWEILDYATIVFEVGFIAAMFRAGSFRFFLIIAVVFHFSTQLLMNIAFLPNFLAYSVFLQWSRIHDGLIHIQKRVKGSGGPDIEKAAIRNAVIGLGIFFAIVKWISLQKIFFRNSDLSLHEFILITMALIVVLFISIRFIRKKYSELNVAVD